MTRKHINIKCPKCNSNPIHYNEIWSGEIFQFDVVDGVVDSEGYRIEPSPIHVIAVCKCKHEWKLKGVTQIIDITN